MPILVEVSGERAMVNTFMNVHKTSDTYRKLLAETERRNEVMREMRKTLYGRYILARNECDAEQADFFASFMGHLEKHSPDEAIEKAAKEWRE